MRSRTLGLGLLLLAITATVSAQEKEATGKLHQKLYEKDTTKLDYLLYLPPDYGKEDKPWPLVLFLHGKGDKLARMKKGGLPAQIERKKEDRFILIAPECPAEFGWKTKDVNALLDDVTGKYKVDKDRVYLTGLSMGGFGTWSLGAANPEKFAALAPICGGGNPKSATKLKDLPIWVFHGAKDETVKPEQSERMVKALKDAGSEKVKFTLYPDAKHDSWTATYKNAEFWDWMLKQKREPAKK